MRQKLANRTLVLVVFAGFMLSPALNLYFVLSSPIQKSSTSPASGISAINKQNNMDVGLPVSLEIPKIKVDAALDYVGITPQGELGVPAGPAKAAWYDQGPRPGQTGNAVIDGHFGYKNHIPAVFDNLSSLQKGDKLYVKDIKGLTTTFVVRAIRSYDPGANDATVFRSSDGKAHLNLITCEGTWNQAQKSYSNRLVVFADKTLE